MTPRPIYYRWPWESPADGWHRFNPPLDARRFRILDAVFDVGGTVVKECDRDVPPDQVRLDFEATRVPS